MPKDKDRYDHYEQGKKDGAKDQGPGLGDILTLGLVSDSSWNPPKEEDDRDAYKRGWDLGKGRK